MRKASSPSDPLQGMSSIFPLMVEHSPVGKLFVDAQGSIVYANPKAEALFGFKPEEMIGQPIETLLPHRFRHGHVGLRSSYLKHPTPRPMGVGRHLFALHKSGKEFPIEIGLVPIKTSKGMMVLATIMDVTAAAENKQLQQDLLHVVEMEQKRIGQDLHDSLGQQLLAISFLCSVLKKKLAAGTVPDVNEVSHIEDLLGEAKLNVRKLTRGLYAGDLESRGLGACLKDMVDHMRETAAIDCIFEGDDTLILSDRSKSENLFRLAQEALNNAFRHSLGKKIVMSLQRSGNVLTLAIRDNGVGFAPGTAKDKGLGLRSMRYRANVIGGTWDITSDPKTGTVVSCSVTLA